MGCFFGSAVEERFPGAGLIQRLGLAAVEDGVLRLTALGNLFAEETAGALVR